LLIRCYGSRSFSLYLSLSNPRCRSPPFLTF
jgi:hypothetical protein